MTPRRRAKTAGIVATLGAAFLWGTSFSVNDIGLSAVGPVTFVVLRFAIAGAVILGALLVLRRFDAGLLRSPFFWLLAAANAAGFVLQYEGQTLTTPARTALLVNTSAFTVALIERFVLRRPLGWGRWIAIAGGASGAAILIASEGLGGGQARGDLYAAGSGVLWAIYFVMNAKVVERSDPALVTGWTFALSALVAAPLLLLDAAPLRIASATGAWAILYAGLVTTAAAYGLWTFGLRYLRPSASAVLLLVEILVASVVSLALRREAFTLVEAAGAALLVASVLGMTMLEERSTDIVTDTRDTQDTRKIS